MTPSIGTPIPVRDLLASLIVRKNGEAAARMSRLTGNRYCCFANSGTAVFYLILSALQQTDSGREIILPAYTAPSLILPITAAGLRPVLCDISLDTFNMNLADVAGHISKNTLAILAVHSFGLPLDMSALRGIAEAHRITLVEDAASSFGTKIEGRYTGSLGDIGFFSFNRGKNLTTFSGGCLVTNRRDWFESATDDLRRFNVLTASQKLALAARAAGYTLAIRPAVYSILEPCIRKFKYRHLHTTFERYQYPAFQSNLAAAMLRDEAKISERRAQNGDYLYQSLQGASFIHLPKLLPGTRIAYNQFPLLFDAPEKRDRALRRMMDSGIEATTLYPEPIHRIDHPAYPLGYSAEPDPFPNASYFAKRLLLIPTHPLAARSALVKAARIILEES
ncbi:MAG: DegT/DnrJ/EryC1/StrS family aminotransferase [Candidatus Zhuqueibacterota bacterium]